jgi:hypothetical protein
LTAFLRITTNHRIMQRPLTKAAGSASTKQTTGQIMAMTRGED